MPRQTFKRIPYSSGAGARKRYPTRRTTPFYKKKFNLQDVGRTAIKALAAVKKVKRVLNTEEKVFDATTAINPTNAGAIQSLLAPPQGDNIGSRDGDSIRPLNLEFKWHCTQQVAFTINASVRAIIFRGYGEHGTAPIPANVLELLTAVQGINAPITYQNRERFTVLYDNTITLTSGIQDGSAKNGSFQCQLSGHTLYTTGATTVEDGGLWLLLITDALLATGPAWYSYSRVWFSDT